MSRYVDAEYVKAVMLNDRLLQGNAEFTLYAQQVETQVNALPSIDIVRCSECKHRKPSGYIGSIKTYECDITGFRMHDLTNHFCSYGEREGE